MSVVKRMDVVARLSLSSRIRGLETQVLSSVRVGRKEGNLELMIDRMEIIQQVTWRAESTTGVDMTERVRIAMLAPTIARNAQFGFAAVPVKFEARVGEPANDAPMKPIATKEAMLSITSCVVGQETLRTTGS